MAPMASTAPSIRVSTPSSTNSHSRTAAPAITGSSNRSVRIVLESQRQQQRAQPEDEQEVHHVGTRDVAHRQRTVALNGGDHTHRELGHARTDRHHGQADDDRADTAPHATFAPPRHHYLGAHNQSAKADQEPQHVRQHQVECSARVTRNAGERDRTRHSAHEKAPG